MPGSTAVTAIVVSRHFSGSRAGKAVNYATCFGNYNNSAISEATTKVLTKNGVETEIVYPQYCGMPQLEHGDIESVARSPKATAGD